MCISEALFVSVGSAVDEIFCTMKIDINKKESPVMNCVNETVEEYRSTDDEDLNCIFCGHVFVSIDMLQTHICEVHEKRSVLVTKSEAVLAEPVISRSYLLPTVPNPEKLTVFDAKMNIVVLDDIRLDLVRLCPRCNWYFVNQEALSQHHAWHHTGQKRKAMSHRNDETIDNTWGCDLCTKKFATLKKANVHKYKSHYEPARMQVLLSKENSGSPGVVDDASDLGRPQYQQMPPRVDSPLPVKSIPDVSSDYTIDLCQSPGPTTNIKQEPKDSPCQSHISDSNEPKISLTKVWEEKLSPKEEPSPSTIDNRESTDQYSCPHCPVVFSSRSVYNRHTRIHRIGKAFVCGNCGTAFTRNHSMKLHKASKCVIVDPVVGVNCLPSDKCPTCSLYFATSCSLLSHCNNVCNVSAEESARQPVQCEDAHTQGTWRSAQLVCDLITAESLVTERVNEFTCRLCARCFPSMRGVMTHLEQYHCVERAPERVSPELVMEYGEVKCASCDRIFTTPMACRVHMTKVHGVPSGTSRRSAPAVSQYQAYPPMAARHRWPPCHTHEPWSPAVPSHCRCVHCHQHSPIDPQLLHCRSLSHSMQH